MDDFEHDLTRETSIQSMFWSFTIFAVSASLFIMGFVFNLGVEDVAAFLLQSAARHM
jgi:hypothetical protein